jgi:hypothetical protein
MSSSSADSQLRRRSTQEVFADHLRLANEHRFQEDLQRNCSPDCVVLERRGIFKGHEGIRVIAGYLFEELGDAGYVYVNELFDGRFAFLEWTSDGPLARVDDGADSYVIENGWIVAQTIHYTVQPKS